MHAAESRGKELLDSVGLADKYPGFQGSYRLENANGCSNQSSD